jgi:hypothetical protein
MGGHEHAGLGHQLGEAESAQKGRLAALVGAGDDDQLLVVGINVVSDRRYREVEGQRSVVEASGGCRAFVGRKRIGEAGRKTLGGELLVEVQAADVEAELGA